LTLELDRDDIQGGQRFRWGVDQSWRRGRIIPDNKTGQPQFVGRVFKLFAGGDKTSLPGGGSAQTLEWGGTGSWALRNRLNINLGVSRSNSSGSNTGPGKAFTNWKAELQQTFPVNNGAVVVSASTGETFGRRDNRANVAYEFEFGPGNSRKNRGKKQEEAPAPADTEKKERLDINEFRSRQVPIRGDIPVFTPGKITGLDDDEEDLSLDGPVVPAPAEPVAKPRKKPADPITEAIDKGRKKTTSEEIERIRTELRKRQQKKK
jgi:hypothetical protein